MLDNRQVGPPGCADVLVEVLERVTYKPEWFFTLYDGEREYEHLAGGSGLTLCISTMQPDSRNPGGERVGLAHYFVVPPAAYSAETWERWLLECIIQIEAHEAMEFFKVDGFAPFFPPHGTANGAPPYWIERRERA